MKQFLLLVTFVVAAVWLRSVWRSERTAERAPVGAVAPQRGIVIATDSRLDDKKTARNTSLAEDDQAMATERLRSWQEKTNPRTIREQQ